MHPFPSIPAVGDAPEALLRSGHLWLQEAVDCPPLRFTVEPSGALRFADADRAFDADGPPAYRHALRHVRERFDREAYRAAVANGGNGGDSGTDGVVFYGLATHLRGVAYDWPRIPSFLGTDVWSGAGERFLAPDQAARAFERLGLDPANTVAREVRAADFDPGDYAFPDSAWYDGPVAGVVIRNKAGGAARLDNQAVVDGSTSGVDTAQEATDSAEALLATQPVDATFERVASALRERDRSVTPDALLERTLEQLLREIHPAVEEGDVTLGGLRAELARETDRFLAEAE